MTHVWFSLPVPLYVSVHFSPTLTNVTVNEALIISRASLCISQRINDKMRFYFSENVRMDDIRARKYDEDWLFRKEKPISIWFSEVLAFLRIDYVIVYSRTSKKRTRES